MAKAPGAMYHSWQCQQCSHRLIDHDLYRDGTPSSPRHYLWGRCWVPGCFCEDAKTAFLTAPVAPPPKPQPLPPGVLI